MANFPFRFANRELPFYNIHFQNVLPQIFEVRLTPEVVCVCIVCITFLVELSMALPTAVKSLDETTPLQLSSVNLYIKVAFSIGQDFILDCCIMINYEYCQFC